MLKLNSFYRVGAGLAVMLLGACAASDNDFDDDFPMIIDEPAGQQQVLPQKKSFVTSKQPVTSGEALAMSSAQPQYNVFHLLDRDIRHVTKLHKDSTRHIMINQEEQPKE